MRALLHVQAGETQAPERAAKAVTAELLASFPRRRQVSVGVLAYGPHPGLTPTPWLLDGVLAALIEAERTPLQFVTLGDRDTGEALARRAARSGGVSTEDLLERPSRDRILNLRVRGRSRPLIVPRQLVGTSLILCAPLCFSASPSGSERARAARRVLGPVATTLDAVATDHGFVPRTSKLGTGLRPRAEDPEQAAAAAAHELLRAGFASVALILDGTWAATVEANASASPHSSLSGRSRGADGRFLKTRAPAPTALTVQGELACADRVLGLADLTRLDLAELFALDRWLSAAVGLETRGREPGPEFSRSPGRWPQLAVPSPRSSQTTRLADRAISGLRAQSQRLRGVAPMAALPARVPGEFASLWTRRWYGEHDLGLGAGIGTGLGAGIGTGR